MAPNRDSRGRFVAGAGAQPTGFKLGKVEIKLNSEEIRKFLQTDEGITKDVQARADNIRDTAESAMGAPPRRAAEHFNSATWVGKDRVHGRVKTVSHEARVAEAEQHVLTRSLDAGRNA